MPLPPTARGHKTGVFPQMRRGHLGLYQRSERSQGQSGMPAALRSNTMSINEDLHKMRVPIVGPTETAVNHSAEVSSEELLSKERKELTIDEFERPKDPILAKYQANMLCDLRRLLRLIYHLSETLTKAMMDEDYFDRLLALDDEKKREVIRISLSVWCRLSTLRMRVEAPLLQADHLDVWELLDDLRDYACSTHTAFFPVVTDNPYNDPLPESLDKRIVYNATEYFAIFDSLLREDVGVLEDLLSQIVPQVDVSSTSSNSIVNRSERRQRTARH